MLFNEKSVFTCKRGIEWQIDLVLVQLEFHPSSESSEQNYLTFLNFCEKKDLTLFEYEAVRWGQKPQIKQQDAENLGLEAEKNDVLLSLHGSYFINLCGKKEVVEASKRRLIACATAAQWMGAYVVVFHPGFYGRVEKSYAFRNCIAAIRDVIEKMNSLGIQKVKLGPETMGRLFQLGTLDEILTICETVEQTQLVIDWSHLHARSKGRFKKVDDFRSVVEEAEKRLGTEAVKKHALSLQQN